MSRAGAAAVAALALSGCVTASPPREELAGILMEQVQRCYSLPPGGAKGQRTAR